MLSFDIQKTYYIKALGARTNGFKLKNRIHEYTNNKDIICVGGTLITF
jgi:hypothetical protein